MGGKGEAIYLEKNPEASDGRGTGLDFRQKMARCAGREGGRETKKGGGGEHARGKRSRGGVKKNSSFSPVSALSAETFSHFVRGSMEKRFEEGEEEAKNEGGPSRSRRRHLKAEPKKKK